VKCGGDGLLMRVMKDPSGDGMDRLGRLSRYVFIIYSAVLQFIRGGGGSLSLSLTIVITSSER